jgi:hypothetical protein
LKNKKGDGDNIKMDLWEQVCETGRWAEVVQCRFQSSVISIVAPYLIAKLSQMGGVELIE